MERLVNCCAWCYGITGKLKDGYHPKCYKEMLKIKGDKADLTKKSMVD